MYESDVRIAVATASEECAMIVACMVVQLSAVAFPLDTGCARYNGYEVGRYSSVSWWRDQIFTAISLYK